MNTLNKLIKRNREVLQRDRLELKSIERELVTIDAMVGERELAELLEEVKQ